MGVHGYQLGSGPARIRLEADVGRGHFAYELELAHSPEGFRELSLGPLGPDWAVSREQLLRNGTTLAEYTGGRGRVNDSMRLPADWEAPGESGARR